MRKEKIKRFQDLEKDWAGKFKTITDIRTRKKTYIPLKEVEQDWIKDIGQKLWNKLSKQDKEFLMITQGTLDYSETWLGKIRYNFYSFYFFFFHSFFNFYRPFIFHLLIGFLKLFQKMVFSNEVLLKF
jgi:hypothetical protein